MVPRLIIGLSNYHDFAPAGEWEKLIDVAAAADGAGVDVVSVVDHVVLGGDLGGYPYGAFPGGPGAPWLEPLVTLAAFAGRTRKVRLMTGILIAPLRPAAVLAKAAATLDQLSGGRLELGVGTGWLPKEYEAVGLSFGDRGRLLDATLDACHELWSPGATDFSSDAFAFSDVHCSPTPVADGGIPFWVGGDLHRRNIERITRRASGWIPSPPTKLAEVAEGAAKLRDAFDAAGRDPAELRVRVSLAPSQEGNAADRVASTFRRLPEAIEMTGATDVFVAHGSFAQRYNGAEDELFAQLVEEFRAALS